ncbi:hypothetical protein, partial [Streptomyces malaysiensis]|uniref:hypothetical protein n=1 Tax=Streptomyces malaysiensis TaxID=92644 RepID=UPI0036C130E2
MLILCEPLVGLIAIGVRPAAPGYEFILDTPERGIDDLDGGGVVNDAPEGPVPVVAEDLVIPVGLVGGVQAHASGV